MRQFLSGLWGAERRGRRAGEAHMTFAGTSIGKTLTRTHLLLKRQLWIWPILAIVLLAVIAWVAGGAIKSTMQASLRSELETLRNVESAMIVKWLKVQEANAESLARDRQVRDEVNRLIDALVASERRRETGEMPEEVSSTSELATIRNDLSDQLAPGMAAQGFVDFALFDRQMRIVASDHSELLGMDATKFERFFLHVFDGRTTVTPPIPSVAAIKDESGNFQTGVPTMFAVAPVRDDDLQVIAALALRLRPEREFTQLLHLGQIGRTGETYAFDATGTFVSNSRFDDELVLLGLLPDVDNAQSILTLQVRDPGGDLTRGHRPTVRRAELPLTRMAASALAKETASDVAGYRDYRGVRVVGAWTWLNEYEMGIATEIDREEAYRPLTILQWTFYTIYVLLAMAAVAIFVFTLIVGKLQQEVRKAAIEAKQLGQYRLEEEIGSGAMGVVYRGHHAMLRRPTAIKMLNVERMDEASVERFEREVQITCQLNSPNTVAIYDYGRTPEGVFYYAMEYLDGVDLQRLVELDGPQPEGRVASILRQICYSLYEAHTLGLVHRDVKPANVMLNRRGGQPDVVKVLDFGLVKNVQKEWDRTEAPGNLSGTPLYLSPEAIQAPESIDARSDLYAVGAIGFFLLTGETVFSAPTLSELLRKHVDAIPDSPSHRLGRPVSAALENAILSCLEKNRTKRPQSARDLALMLDRVPELAAWTLEDADAWWNRHERAVRSLRKRDSVGVSSGAAWPKPPTPSPVTAPTATIAANFDGTIVLESPLERRAEEK